MEGSQTHGRPATPWWTSPGFIAFDTETTGVDPAQDRIVTAAAVRFENGEPVQEWSWLLRCDIPIPEASTAVHGITDEMSQHQGINQVDGLRAMRDCLLDGQLPIVAFNATFDLAMLEANLRRVGLPDASFDAVLCPLVIDKQFNRYVRGRNQRRLKPTAERYGLTISDDDWHGAAADATVTGRILLAELAAYDALAAMALADLAAAVPVWRAEQEASFQAWLASRPPAEST